ncbi:E3 ubiquitin-protein ligase TRIM45 isoform X1 [Stigmatopora argus]
MSEEKDLSQQLTKIGVEEDGVLANPRTVCTVCKHLYREPKILPCLHTFCLDCISRLEPFSVAASGQRNCPQQGGAQKEEAAEKNVRVTVLCPHCDSEVDIPPSGPAGLSTDHLALDEVFLETLVSDGPLGCDLCGEGGAESRCEVCCVNLCEFCLQAHRRQTRTSSHSIQPLQDLKSRGHLCRPVLCTHHQGQELLLFCQLCDLPVCIECASTLHSEHHCCPAHEVIGCHRDRIKTLITARLRPYLQRLEQTLQKVEVSQEALRNRVEAAATEVRKFAQGYASAVETHCLDLLRRLEELHLERRNQLHLQRVQLQQALSDIRGGVDFADRLLTFGSDAKILSSKGVTLRRLSSLAESSCGDHLAAFVPNDGSSIRFDPQGLAGEVSGYPVVGVIHFKALDPSKCSLDEEGLKQVIEGQQAHITLVCRDSSGEQMAHGGDHVLVSIVHREKKNCVVESTVVDNNDGSYKVSYTPYEAGMYSVWVCVKAQHVKGSPFLLNVKKKLRIHTGIFHCCSFCSSGGAKEARCGCPGTMPGGFQGCGHSHKGHPGKPHWSCCGSTTEKSECLPANVMKAISAGKHLRTVEL